MDVHINIALCSIQLHLVLALTTILDYTRLCSDVFLLIPKRVLAFITRMCTNASAMRVQCEFSVVCINLYLLRLRRTFHKELSILSIQLLIFQDINWQCYHSFRNPISDTVWLNLYGFANTPNEISVGETIKFNKNQ